jgi:hypothetical protein
VPTPDAACVNENTLAHVKACLSEERVVRGDERFRHGARLHPIKHRRNTGKITPGHDDKLCLCAAAGDSKNAITNFPGADRIADRLHFAGKFHTRDVLRITRRRGIMSATLQDIGPVQSRCMDTDANAISHRRRWVLDLLHTESVDAAMRCDDDCTHQSRYSSRASIQTNDRIAPPLFTL